MLDAVIRPLNVSAEYMDRISKGDIPPKITDTYNGDFNEIKNNLNVCIDAVEPAGGRRRGLTQRCWRASWPRAPMPPSTRATSARSSRASTTRWTRSSGPLNVSAEYVDRISKGDIPPKITDNYNGDFNEIKNNLNACIDAVERAGGRRRALLTKAPWKASWPPAPMPPSTRATTARSSRASTRRWTR